MKIKLSELYLETLVTLGDPGIDMKSNRAKKLVDFGGPSGKTVSAILFGLK